MVDYAKVPANWRASEPEEADIDGAAPAPVVDVIINDLRKNKETQVLAVQITITLPRMNYAV